MVSLLTRKYEGSHLRFFSNWIEHIWGGPHYSAHPSFPFWPLYIFAYVRFTPQERRASGHFFPLPTGSRPILLLLLTGGPSNPIHLSESSDLFLLRPVNSFKSATGVKYWGNIAYCVMKHDDGHNLGRKTQHRLSACFLRKWRFKFASPWFCLPLCSSSQVCLLHSIQCTSTFLWDSHAKEDDKHPPPFLLLLLFHIHAGAILSRSGSPSHQYRGVRLNCKMFIMIYSTWYHLYSNFGPWAESFFLNVLYTTVKYQFVVGSNCKVYKCTTFIRVSIQVDPLVYRSYILTVHCVYCGGYTVEGGRGTSFSESASPPPLLTRTCCVCTGKK